MHYHALNYPTAYKISTLMKYGIEMLLTVIALMYHHHHIKRSNIHIII